LRTCCDLGNRRNNGVISKLLFSRRREMKFTNTLER
jgi:hypothetical protein